VHDVIVVGGGFAGLTAARDLGAAGHCVLVVEARERLGGRTLYREFTGTSKYVELGGAWFSTTWMTPLREEIERYGVEVLETPLPRSYRWATGGEVRDGAPVPVGEGAALERALYELGAAVRRVPVGVLLDGRGLEDLDVSAAGWIESLELPRATREFLLAWTAMYAGADPGEVSLLAFAITMASFGNSTYSLFDGLAEKFAHGTSDLVERLARDSRGDIRLSTAVRRVEQGGDEAAVVTADGERLTASAAVVAVPINVLSQIEFSPALPERVARAAAQCQPCRSLKVWAVVENVPEGLFAVGWGGGLQWASGEYPVEGRELMVGFGYDPEILDIGDPASVERAIRQFAPGARVLAVDSHDWNADPWSNGAWTMWPPRWATDGTIAALNRPHGRVVFASSDIAVNWPGWIAGAIDSGREAAARVAALSLASAASR
jgi:monoamine oxidase